MEQSSFYDETTVRHQFDRKCKLALDDEVVEGAIDAIECADLMIIGGTSLAVYPAAGLLQYFRGDAVVQINRDHTPYDARATLSLHESIGKVLGAIRV